MSDKVREMFDKIANRYDLANDVLSFGIHRLWRKQSIKEIKNTVHSYLDLCTGSGDFLFVTHKALKPSKIVGVDFSEGMLKNARKRLENAGFKAELIEADVLDLPLEDECFDLVTISFGIRNVDSIQKCLSEIKRVLKTDGEVLVIEFGEPENKVINFFYKIYSKYLMPLIGKIVTGHMQPYKYLPKTSLAFPCGAEFISHLDKEGFKNTRYKKHFGGIAYSYFAIK